MNNREMAMILIVIVVLIIGSVVCRNAVDTQRVEINNQWIEELSRRGIVVPNMHGGFEWIEGGKG